jgi:predicted N-acetyltransferase YhbS
MKESPLVIRSSVEGDREAILSLHRAAFGEAEGEEVSMLAGELLDDPTAKPILSLLAEEGHEVMGHVLFTAVRIVHEKTTVPGQILAPVGVAPVAQGRGIGGALIRAGLKRLAADDTRLVFVLGHPGYYPRFGFSPAGRLGFQAPYPIPEKNADAWMVKELHSGVLSRVRCARPTRALERVKCRFSTPLAERGWFPCDTFHRKAVRGYWSNWNMKTLRAA